MCRVLICVLEVMKESSILLGDAGDAKVPKVMCRVLILYGRGCGKGVLFALGTRIDPLCADLYAVGAPGIGSDGMHPTLFC